MGRCTFILAWLALAATARGQIVVDQVPNLRGGPSSDTSYYYFGYPSWQYLADDFRVSSPANVRRVAWWGFYDADNPPADETFRIRFYSPRPGDGAPGDVLAEYYYSDAQRGETGRFVAVGPGPREFRYQVDLPAFALTPNTDYWLEIVQIDDIDTMFRWESSHNVNRRVAFRSADFPDWQIVQGTSSIDLAFQLSTVPEPATITLFGLILLYCRRKGNNVYFFGYWAGTHAACRAPK